MFRALMLALLGLYIALFVGPVRAAGEQTPLVPSDPHATYAWSWTDCGEVSDIVQIQSLSLSPDPPIPGKNLTVHATGYVSSSVVNGAYADVTVKLGLIKLLNKEFDICTEAKNANVSLTCPVAPGDHEVVHTVALPSQIPPAKFVVEVRAFNADEANLLCIDLKLDFMPTLSRGFL